MLIQIIQFFVALTILIVLHEWGHFYAARLFKTRVEKFYLFFDFLFPLPTVANFSLFKKKIGDTEYGIGWFPFGGYVKIAGMLDESMDEKSMSGPAQPWEYRAKPAWQRLIMIMGGIIVNMLLGILVFWILLVFWGEKNLPTQHLRYGIACDSTSLEHGFKHGDIPVSYDGEPIVDFFDIYKKILLNSGSEMVVLREGKSISIPVTEEFVRDIIAVENPKGFIRIRTPFVLESKDTSSKRPASTMDFMAGDSIIAVNNTPIRFFDEFVDQMKANIGKKVEIISIRNKRDTIRTSTMVPTDGIIGLAPKEAAHFVSFVRQEYSPLEAIPAAFAKTWSTLTDYALQFKLIFNKKIQGYKKVGGFGSMTKAFAPVFNLEYFLTILAVFSISLAFMNFLPIPMLDGGYVIFILIEMITGKELPVKVISYLNLIGMMLIISLMVFANGNDIFGFWR
ncbi:MAG: RIP metalloprotease RseP [Cytophagaceae bacterium]|jgi:regulator of sigma E protease|nr:RIP metalloprotease RseP [Cytophagaceae bacterium]